MSAKNTVDVSTTDMKPRLPSVAVIIPCHNHADYVQEAIVSVAEQDYPLKVAVVVDDGSTDNSADKVRELFSSTFNSREGVESGAINETMVVHLIRNEAPTGPSAARNKGINLIQSHAHIFGMLDADDLYLPGKISKGVFTILQDPIRVGLVYGDVLIKNQKRGHIIHEFREPYNRQRLEQECIISNTPIISKLALETVGVYDENMRTCEDWDLWLRITERFAAIHIPEPLSVYRVTGENASDTVSQEIWQRNWQRVREKMYQRNG